jgi:DNA-binding winged helix-turn-helix (wHTH) protein/Tol biopolymer transport system component
MKSIKFKASGGGLYEFGPFLLDTAERVLLRDCEPVLLTPKAFEILTVLVRHSGHLVEKDELMRNVWPDAFVEEANITQHVSTIRKALGEGTDDHRYIETVPRLGYRFVANVRELPWGSRERITDESSSLSFTTEDRGETSAAIPTARSHSLSASAVNEAVDATVGQLNLRLRSRNRLIWVSMGLILAALFAVSLSRPSLPPKILSYKQITNDGQQKIGLVTDGSRLYISELVDNKSSLVQVSTTGGETVPLTVPFPNPGLDDISANGSELFVASNDGPYPFHYWLVPVTGGSPRPLRDIRAHDVHPSPDGQFIAYFVESDLYLGKSDGTEVRKLVTTPGKSPGSAAWSPDGRRLRFSMEDPITSAYSIWEVAADGSNLHPLLRGWNDPAAECCGRWTPDGKYFLFEARHDGMTDLWAVGEEGKFLGKVNREPVQLTTGPVHFRSPVPSKDGKKIYAIGDLVRGEIMRYEAKSQEWVPYLSGRSIVSLNFSRAGEWVAYTTYPEAALWRSRIDGSQQQQLTFAPMEVDWPSWSPDGKRIVFMSRTPGKPWKIYTVSSTGSNPQQLVFGDGSEAYPDWSPDGKRIIYGGSPFFDAKDVGPSTLQILDLTTNQISTMPDSQGCFGARWSPDGRYIIAHRFDFQKLLLFDFTTGKWEVLAQGILHFANWSRDGKYIYFEKWGSDTAACRIRISDRKLEEIGSLKQFRRTTGPERCWSGLSHDDSLLVLRDIGSQEVYALDWDGP